MTARHHPKQPRDFRAGTPEPFEHISAPVGRVLAELKKKMDVQRK